MQKRRTIALLALAAALLLAWPAAHAEGFKDIEKQVIEKTLPNGIKLIVLPRHDAPVVSMVTYADVGGVDEEQNRTGLAHIFEHMAFKGTTTIGTTDAAKEKLALQKEDDAFLAFRAERLRRPKPDDAKLKELEAALKKAQDEAQKYVDVGALGRILEQEGAQGLNAFTSQDQTVYHYSLPSNKLELWAALESDRFTNPVLREFYREKDVIMEEKRMGESNPVGRLIDDFVAVAYKAHMYRSFVIGNMSDLQNISRADAQAWFKKYYGAKNLTAVVVGDIDPAAAIPLLEKYLGRIPVGQKPGPVITVEPPQRAERRLIMEDPSQPIYLAGYKRPDINDPDDAVISALSDVLAGGRSSRLYTSLVKEKQLAVTVGVIPGFGQKYPGLILFYAVPNKGKTNAECETAIEAEIKKLQDQPVTPEELEGVKARAKSGFIGQMGSNMGLAMGLANAYNLQGDWHKLFRELEQIEKVSAADIQRVAQKLFVKSNRTVGLIETNAGK